MEADSFEQNLFTESEEEADDTPSIDNLSDLWATAPSVGEPPSLYKGPGLQYGKDYEEEVPFRFAEGEAFHNARTVRHILARAILKWDRKAVFQVEAPGIKRKVVGRPRIWALLGGVPGVKISESSSWRDKRLATSNSRLRRIVMGWAERKLSPGEVLHVLVS